MDTYLLTRTCYTGVNEYHCFRGNREIGNALAHVLPSFPVILHCDGLRLDYSHDPEMTLVPGCSRTVTNGSTGEEYARIFRDGTKKHRLQTPFGTIAVEFQDGMYLFIRNNICIGAMRPIQKEFPCGVSLPDFSDPDRELRMSMMTETQLPDLLALLLLSFPLLQIGP